MTIKNIKKDKCTGCCACINICPKNAIDCTYDQEGFCAPKINDDLCVNCGLCYKKCPFSCNLASHVSSENYIAQLKDRGESRASASGGAFIGIAKYFLLHGGDLVVGAAICDDLSVRHIAVSGTEDLKRLQNSKYVQSFIGNILNEVKGYLDSDKKVLFSGTPCQIAGLYSVLNDREKDNLITIDLVCHGVPSPALLKRQINENSRTWQKRVVDYKFRVKKISGDSVSSFYMMMMMMMGPPIVRLARKDIYFSLFLNGANFRESCYSCKYANTKRIADFTIGDCDSQAFYPNFHPEDSNSIILLNTTKAQQMWRDGLNMQFDFDDLDLIREAEYNHQLKGAFVRPTIREGIYEKLLNDDWKELTDHYAEKENKFERFKILLLLRVPNKWKRIYSSIRAAIKGE